MNPAIVIPTFHVKAHARRSTLANSRYDHPTPLNKDGDLARCLASLEKVAGLGQVIILVACEGDIAAQAERKVQQIVEKFPKMHTMVVGQAEASLVQHRIEQLGLGDVSFEIGLEGYGAIRNLGIAISSVLGYDTVVFLDDDEVVDDADFLSKAVYGLGKLTDKGVPILVKSGYYINSEGSFLSMSQTKWYNRHWQQGRAFNRWISKAMEGPRLAPSNHVCGGCLAVHREAFKRLSFDPWITRGEDLDFLLDLRMYGLDVWFDNEWNLRHLPPEERHEGHRFRKDIFRWIYEYHKVGYSREQAGLLEITPSSLEPYPGPFLEPGLENRISQTARLRSWARPDKRAYRDAAKVASAEAQEYAKANYTKYFDFQQTWVSAIAKISNDLPLKQALVQAAVARLEGLDVEMKAE